MNRRNKTLLLGAISSSAFIVSACTTLVRPVEQEAVVCDDSKQDCGETAPVKVEE